MTKHVLDVWSPQLRARRRVDVYLPASYDADSRRRYPVLYMHDGQNLSDTATAFGGRPGHFGATAAGRSPRAASYAARRPGSLRARR